ncbi:hypothetical protein AXK61_06995 [Tsukamurella pseudospumae]|uniref:Uncharacterized protein n=1 Tax=Tsukamurella pseudospumae TaxID=239498 RepID=A0A137YZI9_9ACTN|nr:hypothetical protein AXK61_06995 [Tsukamurella pseudospumae]
MMSAVAQLPYREPTVSNIDEYDAEHGGGAIPDPLLTAQRYTRFYLLGAGDFVFSLGKLLSLEQPMVMSPAVLARSAAEYSSRCVYVSDPTDSPEMRISKAMNLCRDGFNDHGVGKPDADPELIELAKGFNDWSSQRSLPKAPLPNYTNLIHQLSPEMGRREYQRLSGVAHANAITLSGAVISAQLESDHNVDQSWRNALFASHCGVLAAMSVCLLRDGDLTQVSSCFSAFKHYELKYNQFVWDRDVERGITPDWPRPTVPADD